MDKLNVVQVEQLTEAYSKLDSIEAEADKTSSENVEEAGALMENQMPSYGFAVSQGEEVIVALSKRVPVESPIVVQALTEGGSVLNNASIIERTEIAVTVGGISEGVNVTAIAFPTNPSNGGCVNELEWQTSESETFSGEILMSSGVAYVDYGVGDGWQKVTSGKNNLTHNYLGAVGDKTIRLRIQNPESVTRFDIRQSNSKGNIEGWGPALAEWTSVHTFIIFVNDFGGNIGVWGPYLAYLVNIRIFYIDRNQFGGSINNWGPYLENWTNIQYFRLYMNNFEGDLTQWNTAFAIWDIIQFHIYLNSFTTAPYLESSSAWSGASMRFDHNPNIPASNINNILIGLDTHDGTGGEILLQNNNGGSMTYNDLSASGKAAHDSLVNIKGWSITLNT